MNYEDPIVAEVREAGNELARKAGYDVHRFCEMMRVHEQEQEWQVVSPIFPVADPLRQSHAV